MKYKRVLVVAASILAGCTSPPADKKVHVLTPAEIARVPAVTAPVAPPSSAKALTMEAYKEALAHHIYAANKSKVFADRPQALLRSVIVLRFSVDADGKLLRTEVVRSNHDKATETTALASLRDAAPFPQPGTRLLARGKMELSETWLFNNDGRFQLRSIALPQKSDL